MNKFANSYIRGFDQRGAILGIGITNHLCRINGYILVHVGTNVFYFNFKSFTVLKNCSKI